jgi:hypothetical protein
VLTWAVVSSVQLSHRAARISREATSIAIKCSLPKELLDDLDKGILA